MRVENTRHTNAHQPSPPPQQAGVSTPSPPDCSISMIWLNIDSAGSARLTLQHRNRFAQVKQPYLLSGSQSIHGWSAVSQVPSRKSTATSLAAHLRQRSAILRNWPNSVETSDYSNSLNTCAPEA